ncbi:MAG TPA: hypothetical protein VK846_03995 [Candidatus Limnocylindria bacterium]|nr:hypothetical protein [Candidatus Limnocylindria bacterium]
MTSLVHIAPQLPPAIDGVGDYCWNLWKHWPVGTDSWHFAALHHANETARHWPEVDVHGFAPNAESLRAVLEHTGAETAVLHYVGYGFQPKGIPRWLPVALKQWRSASPSRRVVTMFHEMYARSSPLRSPFWLAPLAKRIIRELIDLSDAWATSCERYFSQLIAEFHAPCAEGRIIPIGTNIPLAGPLQDRGAHRIGPENKLRIVVFGLPKTRLWALERHWKLLRALAGTSSGASVTLVGKRNDPETERIWKRCAARIGPALEWRRSFELSPEEISRELANHEAGLLANEPDVLTKSGVFAAFATHGVVPILSTQAGAFSRASLSNAVFVNDDAELIPYVLENLRDPARVAKAREHLLGFASELSWERIGQSWLEVLQLTTRRSSQVARALRSINKNPAEAEFGSPVARV